MMRPRGRCPSLCSPARTEKQSRRGAKGGERKAERSIDSGSERRGCASGPTPLVAMDFQSILDPIFVLRAAMLLQCNPVTEGDGELIFP